MNRYIDADALGIGKADRNAFTVPEYADGWNSAIKIITEAPTADVVEVVRCKDCKHAEIPLNGIFGDEGKRICVRLGKLCLPCAFYCSYGERSENGTH